MVRWPFWQAGWTADKWLCEFAVHRLATPAVFSRARSPPTCQSSSPRKSSQSSTSPSCASRGRHATGIQRISDLLRDVAPLLRSEDAHWWDYFASRSTFVWCCRLSLQTISMWRIRSPMTSIRSKSASMPLLSRFAPGCSHLDTFAICWGGQECDSECAGRPARSRWCKSTTMKE